MFNSSAGDTGPFSAGKIAVLVFAGAKLLAVPTCPALAAALLAAAAARQLPPPTRGHIRRSYARAKQLVRQRVTAAAAELRRILRAAGAQIRVWMANGVLIVAIWVAFASEVFQQFIDTIVLSAEVWEQQAGGMQMPPWAAAAAA